MSTSDSDNIAEVALRLLRGIKRDLLAGRADLVIETLAIIPPLEPVPPVDLTVRAAERVLRSAGWPRHLARDFASRGSRALAEHREVEQSSESFRELAATLNARTDALSNFRQQRK